MLRTTVVFLLAIFGAFGQRQTPPNHVSDRLVAQLRIGASDTAVADVLRSNRASMHHAIRPINVVVLNVPENALDHVQNALLKTGLFTFVEKDGVASAGALPNDPYYKSEWHLAKINAAAAWDITKGVTTSPIAVIDSGVDSTHPDIGPKLVPGWSFLLGTSDTSDVLGHGTAVAGSAAAATDNAAGVSGVAWATKIMPLVVLNSSNYASYSNIASAITYAADHGARVINISIGGSTSSSTLQSAVNYAWNKGAIVFAAAMNNANSTPYYPAACDNVVAVSATTSADALASFSSYGTWVDLSAPGASIYTTKKGGTYGYWSGTSFASPIAAGVAALVLGVQPALANSSVLALLEQNADDLGAAGYDQFFGWGRVNGYKAVYAALNSGSTDTTAPNVAIASPAIGATVSGTVQVQGSATDNVGVVKVEFYLDGALVSSTASSSFAFSWDTAASANGSHTLFVKAYDLANNVGAAPLSVTVGNTATSDTQPPAVSVSSPLSGTRVSGNVSVSVAAADSTSVSQVAIYIDNVQVATCTASPCVYTWNTRKVSSGSHSIVGKAWDPAGNMGISSPETVTK